MHDGVGTARSVTASVVTNLYSPRCVIVEKEVVFTRLGMVMKYRAAIDDEVGNDVVDAEQTP